MPGCVFCKSLLKFHHLFSLLGNQSLLFLGCAIGSTPFAIMGKTKATNFLRLIAFALVILCFFQIKICVTKKFLVCL